MDSKYAGKKLLISVSFAGFSEYMSGQRPTAGRTFLSLGIGAMNTSAKPLFVNPNDFTLRDSQGETVAYDESTYSSYQPFPAEALKPGESANGGLVFQVKRGAKYVLTRRDIATGEVETITLVLVREGSAARTSR